MLPALAAVLGERLSGGFIGTIAVVVGLALMVFGVVLCALGSAYHREPAPR